MEWIELLKELKVSIVLAILAFLLFCIIVIVSLNAGKEDTVNFISTSNARLSATETAIYWESR